jgi:hypothetical protein
MCIKKVKRTAQLKDVFDFEKRAAVLAEAFAVDRALTITAITNLLASEGQAAAVFLLTLTRTRSRS